MSTERMIRIVAGSFFLISLALGAPSSPFFQTQDLLWLGVFVSIMLIQSAFTGFCPAEKILGYLEKDKSNQKNGCGSSRS